MSAHTPYGNFHNYYAFNKVEERLQFLRSSPALLQAIQQIVSASETPSLNVLDVGCNAGDISVALATLFTSPPFNVPPASLQVVGADLDPELIARACTQHASAENVSFFTADLMKPASLSHLPRSAFELVLALSITMWIHVNHGDEGLDAFLRRLCSLAPLLLIEPQPWKCYRTLATRRRKAGLDPPPLLADLTHRVEVVRHIHDVLVLEGMELMEEMGTTKWGRSLRLYRRREQL